MRLVDWILRSIGAFMIAIWVFAGLMIILVNVQATIRRRRAEAEHDFEWDDYMGALRNGERPRADEFSDLRSVRVVSRPQHLRKVPPDPAEILSLGRDPTPAPPRNGKRAASRRS